MSLAFLGFPPGARLANPEFLVLLLGLAIYIYLYFTRFQKRNAAVRFSSLQMAARIKPGLRVRLRHLPRIMLWLALALFTIALARPQVVEYETLEEVLTYGADIMLAIDVSDSMQGMDFQPDNRLFVAKKVVTSFIEKRKGDQIGLVAFGSVAVTMCPLTTNMDFLRERIASLDFNEYWGKSTAIGTAISTALNRMEGSKARSKVIILLTDGQNNAGDVQPMDAAEIAKQMEVKVYTVGIGSDNLVEFPARRGFAGGHYRVPLDEELLKEIAERTGGIYRKATDTESLERIYEEINALEKTEVKAKIYSFPVEEEFYPWFLYAGLAGILLWLMLIFMGMEVTP